MLQDVSRNGIDDEIGQSQEALVGLTWERVNFILGWREFMS